MADRVYVVTGNERIIRKCLSVLPSDSTGSWIYLGKEVQKCKKIEDIFGRRAQREGISRDLQQCARTCRQEYIDYIGRLSKECDNPLWPLTTLAEKNPFVSDFFLFFCYLKICLKFMQENPGTLIVVCESRCVFDAVRDNLDHHKQGYVIFLDSSLDRMKDRFTLPVIRSRNKLVFLVRYLLRVFIASFFSRIKGHSTRIESAEPVVVMHSWADSRSFSKRSDYMEVYLGTLGTDLEKTTPGFMYLVHVLPTVWYITALKNFLSVDKKIYLIEEFLTAGDIFRSYTFVNKNYPKYPVTRTIGDINVSALISHDIQTDAVSSRLEQVFLNYYISKDLSRRFLVRSFIYPFENHIWEKAFCMGFRSNKETKTIGYAIVFINRMYTCYSISPYERESTYLPDRIFVSGPQGKKMLMESGFDDERIHIGGAIRYPYINDSKYIRKVLIQNAILVILGPSVSQSLEILLSVIEAFKEEVDLTIIIKCHPIVPYRSLSEFLSNLPCHFHIADQTVEELLEISGLVIYADSTVSIEAMARGIPVLHLNSNFTIDINILEGVDFVPSAGSPEEAHVLALQLLRSGKIPLDRAHEIIDNLFAPVDIKKIKSVIQ